MAIIKDLTTSKVIYYSIIMTYKASLISVAHQFLMSIFVNFHRGPRKG